MWAHSSAGCARSATSIDVRTLHVAALPFPSAQGTQALLHAMLTSLQTAGHDTHLLCYPHGAAVERSPAYQVHRSALASRSRSLRSGPALDKPWLDLGLALRLRRLYARYEPDALIAHHVEAAACALALRLPYVFVAHTSLREELPTYAPASAARLLGAAGGALDALLVRRARATLSVSPLLASLLTRESRRAVAPLPLPWQVPAPIAREERERARARLSLKPEHVVLLYAGNLDAYQGFDALLPPLARVFRARPHARLLIASEQSRELLRADLARHGLTAQTLFAPLASEQDRRRAHAAANVALVPRRAAGGIPIKLLDAWVRGVPVLASRLALAGHELDDACEVVERDADWELAILRVWARLPSLERRADDARAQVARLFDPAHFVSTLESVVRTLR